MNERRRSRGFTLLEALIAVSIMAMVVSVLYATFRTTVNNVTQADAMRTSLDLGRTVLEKISNDVTNAYFSQVMNAKIATTVFYGKKGEAETADSTNRYDSLALTTLTNWRRPDTRETDLWEVGYFFKQKPDGTGYVLYRRENREPGRDTPVLEGGTEYAITDRVASLLFRYYNGSQWFDEWDTRTRRTLPREVEIALVLDDGSSYGTHVEVGR